MASEDEKIEALKVDALEMELKTKKNDVKPTEDELEARADALAYSPNSGTSMAKSKRALNKKVILAIAGTALAAGIAGVCILAASDDSAEKDKKTDAEICKTQCADGTCSPSTGPGTCSYHGGIKKDK